MNERPSTNLAPLVLEQALDSPPARRAGRRRPLRLPCPYATAALDLDGRVWMHRVTCEIRSTLWTPAGIEFHNPQTNDTFVRSHRKAIAWCSQADDVTPAEEPAEPDLAALPPEIPACPVAECARGGGS